MKKDTHLSCEITTTDKNFFSSEREANRLMEQQRLLQPFDLLSYKKIFKQCPRNLLDIGSNNGTAFMQRIEKHHYHSFDKLIGIDINQKLIQEANRYYSDHTRIKYYSLDIENENFLTDMAGIMAENGIKYFDFINISSVMLLLENPFEFLLKVNEILDPNVGTLLILDIDDGLTIAYPDEYNLFRHLFDICDRCKFTGNRKTGREIFSMLKKATNCRNITLDNIGLNTTAMSESDKMIFADIIIKFIGASLERESLSDSQNSDLMQDLSWFKLNINRIKRYFSRDDFFLSLGYVIFVARRC